jgi:hypothetical protein
MVKIAQNSHPRTDPKDEAEGAVISKYLQPSVDSRGFTVPCREFLKAKLDIICFSCQLIPDKLFRSESTIFESRK